MGYNWEGLITWMGYVLAFMGEIFKHLFVITADLSGRMTFTQVDPAGGGLLPSKGQWIVEGNIPGLTDKGEDIVAALMTIIHNGIVAVAQFTTLLPATPLSP